MSRPTNATAKADYYNFLTWLFSTLKDLGEDTGITEVNDDTVAEAEKKTKELIDQGYFYVKGESVPAGTDPSEFIMSLANIKNRPRDPSANVSDTSMHILSKPNNKYVYFNVSNPENAMQALFADDTNYPNANVLQGANIVSDFVNKLSADLNSTKRPWSSDSDDFKKVDEKLEALKKRLNDLTHLSNDYHIHKRLSAYTYRDLANEFTDVLSAIQDYSNSHARIKNLSDRQVNRLEIMNTIQSTYDNIQKQALNVVEKGTPLTFTLQNIETQKFNDKLAMFKIQQASKDLYRAALTDRNLFRVLRRSVVTSLTAKNRTTIHQEMEKKNITIDNLDLKTYLKIESTLPNDPGHPEGLKNDFGSLKLHGKALHDNAVLRKKYLGNNRTEASEQDIYNELVLDETEMLHALAKDYNPDYKKPKKSDEMSTSDYSKIAENNYLAIINKFTDDVKNNQVLVFDKNGKIAPPSTAIRILADKIAHPDNNPAFFRWDANAQSYIGREFEFANHSTSVMVSGFKANPEKAITKDYFLVCDQVLKDVKTLWEDLDKAKSFFHSSEHNKMKDALEDIYKEFAEINFSECKSLQLKNAFAKLNDTAEKYISLHNDGNINDNQRERLSVAQRITAINDVLGDTNLSYDKYLKAMYAKKIMLDTIAVTNELTKAKIEDPDTLEEGETISKVRSENKRIGRQLCTVNHTKEFDIKKIMNSDVFRKLTNGKNNEDLQKMLNDTKWETADKINDVKQPEKVEEQAHI